MILSKRFGKETAVEPPIVENDFIQFDDLESTQVTETPFDEKFDTEEAVETEYPMVDSEDGQSVRKQILYGLLAAVGILVIGTGYYVYSQVARSTKEIQTSQSTTNSQAEAEEFNNLYDAFYTDSNKNSFEE